MIKNTNCVGIVYRERATLSITAAPVTVSHRPQPAGSVVCFIDVVCTDVFTYGKDKTPAKHHQDDVSKDCANMLLVRKIARRTLVRCRFRRGFVVA